MSKSYEYKQRWRVKAKEWVIEYAGGHCQGCGYDRYRGNLTFHHPDPDNKKDEIGRLIRDTAGWKKILAEADRCVLVCTNCHGEIHAGLRSCPEIDLSVRTRKLEEIESRKPIPKTGKFHYCPVCGEMINKTKKFCSQECVHKSQEKVKWPDNLATLVERSSKRAIAKNLGVSDKAVAKRLKNESASA